MSYAKHSFDVEMTIDEAKQLRRRLITEIYPELNPYLQDKQYQTIAANLHTTEGLVRQALPKRKNIQTAQQIISGCDETPDGDIYSADLVRHVWNLLQQLNKNPDLLRGLIGNQPSTTLMRQVFFGTAATISGRLRGHVNFTQQANTPFQGLAADGNKLALFRLLQHGYQVCAFVHDEMLVLIPDGTDYTAATQQVQQILRDAMQELTPDVPICSEYLLADRWYKDADQQPTDSSGRIVPYIRPPVSAPAVVQGKVAIASRKRKRRVGYDPDSI